MIPPGLYDQGGNLMPERRHTHGRRHDDGESLPPEVERGIRMWIKLMFIHRGKLLALGLVLGSPLGYIAGCAGRLHDLDALTVRVTKVEGDVGNIRAAAALQNYLLCLSTPATAPKAVQKMCEDILLAGVKP